MYTPFKLDKVRNFKFGMRAIDRIEKELKTSVGKLDLDDLTMEQASIIIWAGLAHEDKDLTPDKVIDLIDEHSSLVKALKTMAEAFGESFSGDEVTGEESKN